MNQKASKLKSIIFMLTFLFSSFVASSNGYSNQYKIIMLGDSLTAGYGVGQEHSYPTHVEKILNSKNIPVELINAGISGSTTASAVSRLKWLLNAKPTHLFLALGANDGLRGFKLDVTEKNLREAIRLAKENNIKVFLAGMMIPPNYGIDYTEKFKNLFVSIARKEKVPLLPFLLEGVAGEKDLNIADGIHPNIEGHKIIAKNVAKFFEKELK
jgi:acyl-CoA thioesterase-1